MRRFVLATVGAAVVAAGIVGLAGTAAADTHSTAYITRPTTGYQHPTNQSAPVLTGLKQGQSVTALCFAEGQVVNDNPYWFRISTTPTPEGNTAFVHRDAISVGPDLRHC